MQHKKRVNVVIPAAGAATRLRPLSSNCSKAMVRVNGRPCIDFILEQVFKLATVEQVVIVDGKLDDIREYVSRKWAGFPVSFAKQPEPVGPRDAIARGCEALGTGAQDLPLVVWLGDTIILDELPLGEDVLFTRHVDDQSIWCMWDGRNFHDKPEQPVGSAWALVGVYSFRDGAEACALFSRMTAYDISSVLREYLNVFRGWDVHAWYDIGEPHTYFRTCAELLNGKARAFNRFEYDPDCNILTKAADFRNRDAVQRIEDEKFWYACLDDRQRLFTPRVLECELGLSMSYEPGILLSDLALYDDIPESTWRYILGRLIGVVQRHFHSRQPTLAFVRDFGCNCELMWLEKTQERAFRIFNPATENQKLFRMADEMSRVVKPVGFMHGDLHLGNVLYNPQTDHFTLVDPRGRYGEYQGPAGDDHYDWAKLAQDCVFGYNASLAGVEPNPIVKRAFLAEFASRVKLPADDVLKGALLLMASCIPMHSEDPERQERFKTTVRAAI